MPLPVAPEIVPLSLTEARQFVAAHHRHNEPPRGHKFSIGLRRDDQLLGVVIAARPIARASDDGRTIELIRLTTTGDRNACSRLYSAACRAAAAMGYLRAITYTLESEPGSSLMASGSGRRPSCPTVASGPGRRDRTTTANCGRPSRPRCSTMSRCPTSRRSVGPGACDDTAHTA